MSRGLVTVALAAWLVFAAGLQTARPFASLHEWREARPTQAVLSVASGGGAAMAARTTPSPSPARDTQGLAFLALPAAPTLSALAETSEASADLAPQLAALPHRQRGPPAPR